MRKILTLTLICLLSSFGLTACGGGSSGSTINLRGAGATFPTPLYQKWATEFTRQQPNIRVDYQSIGSGGGVQQVQNRTVDFGASDDPVSDEQLAQMPTPIVQLPVTAGTVAIAYNLPGVGQGIKLTPEILADIYLGKLTKWNDPRITTINAGLNLPDQNIVPVYRSDGSGTTAIFTTYLSSINPEWQTRVGKGKAVQWPTGQGAKGNEGVANAVRQTPGSLGYVELAYVVQNNINYAALRNQEGNFVLPSTESAQAALTAIVPQMQQDVRQMAVNQPGAQSYPITGFTYLLIYRDLPEAAKGKALVDYLWWAIHEGQQHAAELHYVPLPESVVKLNETLLRSLTLQGQPVQLP